MLDEVAKKVASLGLPGIMFAVALSTAGAAGLAGGAAITAALAMLGGPFGMLGGLSILGIATVIGDAVARYGIDAVLVAAYRERLRRGETAADLRREIGKLWISDALARSIRRQLGI